VTYRICSDFVTQVTPRAALWRLVSGNERTEYRGDAHNVDRENLENQNEFTQTIGK
jgi:hypothetical protein